MDITKGIKTSELWVVVALVLSNFFGFDVGADETNQIKEMIAQAHGNTELVYLGIAYVLGRSWIKGKEIEKK